MRILLAILLLGPAVQAAPIVLQSRADTTETDTIPPLAHSLFIDTTTAADTFGYSIDSYISGHRWPDSVIVRLRSVNWGILDWSGLAEFTADSLDGRRVWWSGSTMLEDSVIVPGSYVVSGDSLVVPGQ